MSGGKKNTASSLRHRLTLQQEVKTADGAGGYVRTWQNVADLWAEIISVNLRSYGNEKFIYGQIESEISHRVTIRYRSALTTNMRLLFGSRIFNIRSIFNKEENNEILELLVEEGSVG